MVNPSEDERVDADDQLHELIAEYHDRVDQGETLDPVGFTAEHPELEAELSRYFENVATVESLAGPTASQVQADPSATVISGETHDGGHAETMIENSKSGNTARISKDAPLTQFGRYRIRKELGRGAMGAVYLAHDEQLDREVALKIPKFDADTNEELLERFYREARAAAALQHPGICPVYDVGELDGQHYITMAFIKGRPLRDFTKSSKRQKGKQVARVIRKIAMAMAEAHEHNVVHRDLKPANIMINEKNEPVVMDFGLARRSAEGEEQLTHTGTVIGTPAYMSPEQVDGDNENVGPHSDIYSLGVIFYEMLTGQLPFQGNLMSILKQIALTEPQPPVEIHADIDPSLQAICLKMMAKKSEERPESMSDVTRDLTMWLQGRQVVADEAEPLETSRVPGQSKGEEVSVTTPVEESVPAIVVQEPEVTLTHHGRKRSAEGSPPDKRKLMIAGGLGGVVILLGAIVFFVRLGKVNVQITIDDPSLALKVDDGDIVIEGEGKPIRLSAGPHKLQVERDGLEVATDEFVVKKDGKNAIRVAIVGSEVFVLKNGQKPPESNPDAERDDTAVAATTASKAPAKVGHSGDAWRPLFNGHSLDGWKRFGSTGNDWRVENGMLIGDGDRTSLAYTREKFSDFDVRVECRLSDHANAGLYLRCSDRPGPGLGFEAQLAGRNGVATGGNLTGSLFFKADFKEDLVPANEWFVLEARCRGPRITLFVNGQQTVAYVDSTNGNRTGLIGLQSWAGGHTVEFRKIEARSVSESLQTSDTVRPPLAVAPFDADQAKAHQQAWADYLGVPVEKEVKLPGGETMTFVLIPPGRFMMGSSDDEKARFIAEARGANDEQAAERIASENQLYEVELTRPFWLSRHEITRGQFRQFVAETDYKTSAETDGSGGRGRVDGQSVQSPTFIWSSGLGFVQTDEHPVVNVSWYDANAFCDWMAKEHRMKFHLPTESEWEFACRAGTTTPWYGSTVRASLGNHCWWGQTADQKTHPVGQLTSNAFGVFDMHGNVREWCELSHEPETSSTDPDTPAEQSHVPDQVCRGGGWLDPPRQCRAAHRGVQPAAMRSDLNGFRVAITIDQAKLAQLKTTDAFRTAPVPRNQAELLTSPDWMWSAPARLPEPVNSEEVEGGSSFSSDGNMLLFSRRYRNRSEGDDLMVSTRSSSGEWSSPQPLLGEIQDFGRLGEPHLIVENGNQSLYVSGHAGNVGVSRLLVSRRDSETSTWPAPESLGDAFDSDSQDQAPSLSADGCVLVFHAHRRKGVGKTDIFESSRPSIDAEWSTPIHVGNEVNTKGAESHPCLSSDGLVLMFLRAPAKDASQQLWQSVRRDRNSAWESPVEVSFSNEFSGTIRQPALSPDGRTLIFSNGHDLMISHRINTR